jgi:uroporphyrinogen-III synthase
VILNTRPSRYQAAFADAFEALGHEIVSAPMLSVEHINTEIPPAEGFDAVIFTSQVAVNFFPQDEAWRHKHVFAVGTATAKAAEDAGFRRVTCTGEDAADLLAALNTAEFKQALFPSARDVAADLSTSLPGRITRVVTYAALPTPYLRASLVHRLKAGEFTVVPLFSSRSARAFREALSNEGLKPTDANIVFIAISPKVANVLAGAWPNVVSAPHMTAASLADTATKYLHAAAARAA